MWGFSCELLRANGQAAVPLDGAAQAFVEVDFGLIAEGFAGKRDVGEGVGDVSGARGGKVHGGGVAGQFAETFYGIEEGDALPGGDVEYAAGDGVGRGGDGAEIGVHDVFNEGEVAALGAISVDDWGAAFQHGEGELGEHAGVLGRGVLMGTEDVEVTDGDRLKAVDAGEAAHVMLAGKLADGVGGDGVGEHVFTLGKRGLIAVSRGGASVDDAADSGVAGGDEQVESPGDVGGVGGDGVLDGARDAGKGGLVEDEIDALADSGASFGIFDGAFDKVDAVEVLEIGVFAGNEVVNAADRGSLGEQSASNVGTDEACNSGNSVQSSYILSDAHESRSVAVLRSTGAAGSTFSSGQCLKLAVNNV